MGDWVGDVLACFVLFCFACEKRMVMLGDGLWNFCFLRMGMRDDERDTRTDDHSLSGFQ